MQSIRRLLFAVGVLVIPSPVLARTLNSAIEEYSGLVWRLDAIEKSIAHADPGIFPALDEVRRQETQLRSRLEVERERIAGDLVGAAAGGETTGLRSAIMTLRSLPECDHRLELERAMIRRLQRELLAEGRPERRRSLIALQESLESPPASKVAKEVADRTSKPIAPVYVTFHWHMHQPIYWPYEDILATESRGAYSFGLVDLFRSRHGPYTSWPRDAIAAGRAAGLGHLGAQVSFSGSLIENLDRIATIDRSFENWTLPWREARQWKTALGHPRLDLVAFGYHHPLMALIDHDDIRRQIRHHKEAIRRAFGDGVPLSRGIFPPENGFAEWMIPALVDEDLSWVFVDNIHFSRACQNYPWAKGENLAPPNAGEQVNPDPGGWLQLQGLWAPSREPVWSSRPHYVAFRDPDTGQIARTPGGREAKMIAVPTSRYLGNEDGRGGFGALDYERVMSQFLEHNTDPRHPVLIVLHHDGDNYGGGTESYYHANFQRFVEWVKSQPDRFVATTVEDYLEAFPPDPSDVIHVEPGSWSGADNGDPEFLKWNGDPDPKTGYSPDRNSWGVLTAVRNVIRTAEQAKPDDPRVEAAWRLLLVSETSCYEYWDGTEMWDSHPTRGANQAHEIAVKILAEAPYRDVTPPTIYAPQRDPYNPGAREWGDDPMPSEFTVWTYAHDISGLREVSLELRVEEAGRPTRDWARQPMSARSIPPRTVPLPAVKADEYAAKVALPPGTVCLYRVVATDQAGNTSRSIAQRVAVGKGTVTRPPYTPPSPTRADRITFTSDRPGFLHWGIDGWTLPPERLRPPGSREWPDGKAIETPLADGGDGVYQLILGPFEGAAPPVRSVDIVFHHADGSWGRDHRISFPEQP